MRRALAVALTMLAAPATVQAAMPYEQAALTQKARASHARGERPVAIPGHLAAIAQCESSGNPRAIGGGGQYRGLFQFDTATWQAVGGQGDPAAASVAEQVKRAQILYAQAGPGQWPVCGA
jgi:hypothetical protein